MTKYIENTSQVKELDTPEIRGPFRGILITFPENPDFKEFHKIYPSLTFEHPNFYCSKSDKHKYIIYYKYTYDIAILID